MVLIAGDLGHRSHPLTAAFSQLGDNRPADARRMRHGGQARAAERGHLRLAHADVGSGRARSSPPGCRPCASTSPSCRARCSRPSGCRDHLVPGTNWAPPEWDTLECMTALIHFASVRPGVPLRPDRARQLVPSAVAAGQDVLDPAGAQPGAPRPRHRRRLDGERVPDVRLRVPAAEGPHPAARRRRPADQRACGPSRRPASQGRHYSIDHGPRQPAAGRAADRDDRRLGRAADAAGRRQARRLVERQRRPRPRSCAASWPSWPSTARRSGATSTTS